MRCNCSWLGACQPFTVQGSAFSSSTNRPCPLTLNLVDNPWTNYIKQNLQSFELQMIGDLLRWSHLGKIHFWNILYINDLQRPSSPTPTIEPCIAFRVLPQIASGFGFNSAVGTRCSSFCHYKYNGIPHDFTHFAY